MRSVLVGMSGGVDSSVTAALLKEQGYNVAGATMLLSCNTSSDDAKRVCDAIGIDFYELDFRDKFRKCVIDYFIDEYTHGRTPNPCIQCNKNLKFGAMLEKAVEMGFDYIATGHYAKISEHDGKYYLKASDAGRKDQSYFLYNFNQYQLSHTLMPLGEFSKDKIRSMAQEYNLPVANKPDSQEICFVPNDDYAEFITGEGYVPKKGDILDSVGNVIGEHKGLIYYTIGQRKGIGAYGRPMFVKEIDTDRNKIILGEKGEEFSNSLTAYDVHMISGDSINKPFSTEAKIRYQAQKAGAIVYPTEDGRIKVEFNEAQRAVTPGQAVVFYDGDTVIGGATVEKAL